jgi:hypothetical protein
LVEAGEKLGTWRKKAVERTLSQEGELKPELLAAEVYYASQLVHEHHENVYRKLGIIGRQFGILVVIAVLAVLCWIVVGPWLDPDEAVVTNRATLVSVALFGVMGASVSGILSLARNSASERIPQQVLSSWFTLARPVVGAVAAAAIYAFLNSGLISLGRESLGLVLAVSFAAGFSERLVAGAVEAVASAAGA